MKPKTISKVKLLTLIKPQNREKYRDGEKKILVVDDEEAIRDSFEIALNKAGYIVHSAESAERAIEILNQENIN